MNALNQRTADNTPFEFVVEYDWRHVAEFVVFARDLKTARAKLWDEVLQDHQRDNVASIEHVGP